MKSKTSRKKFNFVENKISKKDDSQCSKTRSKHTKG